MDWILVPFSSFSSRSRASCFVSLSLSFICKPRLFCILPDLTLSNFSTSFGDKDPLLPTIDWEDLGLYCYVEAFILLSSWFLVLPCFCCCCWDGFLVSLLELPSNSPFFVLQLTNDGETGPWRESELPMAEGGSAQITTKFLNPVPVEILILILFSHFV